MVRANHKVAVKRIGTGQSTDAPIDLVSVTHRVSYADLDLSTAAGRAELKSRIEAKAREGCGQIGKLYPEDVVETSNRQCVDAAVKDALSQAHAAIAAAPASEAYRSARAPAR